MYEYDSRKTFFIDKLKCKGEKFKVLYILSRMKNFNQFYVIFLGDLKGVPIKTSDGRYWATSISGNKENADKIKVGSILSWDVDMAHNRIKFNYIVEKRINVKKKVK